MKAPLPSKVTGAGDITGDLEKSAITLYQLMRIILKGEENTPAEWKKELIVVIPKKGDHRDCNCYRGILLLSTLAKVSNCIILKRLFKERDDDDFREKEIGFVRESFFPVTKLLKLLRAAPQAAVESHGA